MRRAFLAALAVALVLAAPALASDSRPTLADLEDEVMCPTCDGQTLDQSSAPAALRVKAFIRERIAAGDTKSEIKAKLVDEFGERILAAPPRRGFNLLAWLLPLLGLLTGAVVVGIAAWRWSHAGGEETEPPPAPEAASSNGRAPVDVELDRRLDEELARFD
jgi:cytochrome c-type biogenesis protein CcmH